MAKMDFAINFSLHLSAWGWIGFLFACILAIMACFCVVKAYTVETGGSYLDFSGIGILLWLLAAVICVLASILLFVLVL